MTTLGKVAIGAAVIGGAVIVYKLANPSKVTTIAKGNTPAANSLEAGFLNLGNSLATYFGHSSPSPQSVPSVGFPPVTFDSGDTASVNEFRAESPDMTDAQRDAALLG